MHKLYVEPSDEITTVIERLKAAPEKLVALVAPKGATLLQSIVNLKLARRAANDAGKELVIVTTDKIGRNLATQLGIPVASTESEVAKVLQEGGLDQEQPEADVIGGVRIHRYYDEGEAPDEQSESPTRTAVEPIIIPKKLVTPVQAVAPESIPEIVRQEIPVEKPEEAVVTDVPTAPITPEDMAPPVIPVDVPNLERRSIDRKPLTPPSDTSISRTPIAPRTALAGPRKKVRRKIAPFVLYCGALLLVALIAISFLFLPITDAKVTVKADQWKKDLSFNTSTDIKSVSADYTSLPATIQTVDVTDSQDFKATGTKDVGTNASGTVTLFNSKSTTPQILPAGTIVTAGGLQFTTSAAASIPGYVQAPGKPLIPGTASVAITANAAGTASNITGTSIGEIIGNGIDLTGSLTAAGGTSKQVAIISDADVTGAKAALAKKLGDEVTQKLTQLVTDKALQFNATTDTTTSDVPSLNVSVGDQVDTGKVTGAIHVQRLTVATADITAAARARSLADTPNTSSREITGTTVTAFTPGKDGKSATITSATTGKQSAILNTATIQKQISGKTLADAQAYIAANVPNATLSISQKPGWWPLKRLPFISHFLTVSVSYE